MIHLIFLTTIFFSFPALNKEKKAPLFLMSFLLLFFFLAIRYDYGNDFKSYLSIYENIKSQNFAWGASDIGYKLFNQISPSFQFLIIIQSLFYIITIFFLMKSGLDRRNLWIGFVILLLNPYLFLIHLSSLRQTIAMCFFICAVLLLIRKNKVLGIIFVFLAISFHKSALILIPVLFLLNERKQTKIWVQGSFATTIILVLTPLFDYVLDFVVQFLPAHYSIVYLNDAAGNSLQSTVMSFILYLIVVLNYEKLEGREIIFGKLVIIGSVISILTYKISMLTRVQTYFDIFFIVLFPIILDKQNSNLKKVIIFCIVIGIYSLRYYSFFTNPLWIEGYEHYKSIFSF